MLNHYKYFKYSRKAGFNLHNSPKLAFFALRLKSEKHWASFSKPFKSVSNLFWVSKYYSSKLSQTAKNIFVFFKRKKKQIKNSQQFSCLDTCLFAARFFKTLRQARSAIYSGFVCVNGVITKKPDRAVFEGDLLTISLFLLKKLAIIWRKSFFFSFFKGVKVFSQIVSSFEISYSTGSVCVCYTQRAVSSMEERFFYTKDVSGSSPLLPKLSKVYSCIKLLMKSFLFVG